MTQQQPSWRTNWMHNTSRAAPEEAFRVRVVNNAALAFGFLTAAALVARQLISPLRPVVLWPSVALMALLFVAPFLGRRLGKAWLSASAVMIALLGLVWSAAPFNGGIRAPIVALLPMVPIVGHCFGGKILGIIGLLGAGASPALLVWLERTVGVAPQQDPANLPVYSAIVLTVISISTFMLGAVYERSRRLSAERIISVSRLASLGGMAAGIAHEVNNPLTVIHARVRRLRAMVKSGRPAAEDLASDLETVDRMVGRITEIVKSMRTFSRSGEREPRTPEDLAKLVQGIVALSRERLVNAGIDVQVNLEATCVVHVHVPQIGQVLFNLLNNAFDAVQGKLNSWVRIVTSVTDGSAEIAVIDSGRGIPVEIAARIMEPFFTTKDVSRGTGVGLSVAKGIVEDHGGTLELDYDHANTRFVVRLPLRK